MRKAFSQRGFPRLFSAISTSMFGDSLMLIVLSMWVKSLTDSNAAAGMTFFWLAIPSLFAPLVGLYVDRVRRKPLLIWANVASAVLVLPLLFVRDASQVWVIYLVAFFYGISFVVIPAGLNGLLKEVMPEDLLVEANSSLQTIKESFRLVGPLAGAGLFAGFGGGAVAVLDAISFLIAAAVISSLKVVEDVPERSEQHWRQEMTEGIRHIAGEPLLKHTLLALGLCILVLGFSESLVFALTDAFDKPVEYVGFMLTIQGVGAIAGGLTAPRIVRKLGEAGALALALAVLALGLAVIGVAPSLWLVLVGIAILGYSLPPMMIAFGTLMQLRTPGRLMGRVSTATDVVLGTPQTLSIAIGALLVTRFSYRTLFGVMAAVTALAVVYLGVALKGRLFESSVRGIDDQSVTGATQLTRTIGAGPVSVGSELPVSGLE